MGYKGKLSDMVAGILGGGRWREAAAAAMVMIMAEDPSYD